MKRQLVPSGFDLHPRSWYKIHPWHREARDRDPEAWRDGLRAGLDLWRKAEAGDPMAASLRDLIEREQESDDRP